MKPKADALPCCGVTTKNAHILCIRLQNSPYFCVFKYARAVKQKVCNEAENRERDWGETLSPHTRYGRVRLARFARVRLLRHALPISLLILRKKPTVLLSNCASAAIGFHLLHTQSIGNSLGEGSGGKLADIRTP